MFVLEDRPCKEKKNHKTPKRSFLSRKIRISRSIPRILLSASLKHHNRASLKHQFSTPLCGKEHSSAKKENIRFGCLLQITRNLCNFQSSLYNVQFSSDSLSSYFIAITNLYSQEALK